MNQPILRARSRQVPSEIRGRAAVYIGNGTVEILRRPSPRSPLLEATVIGSRLYQVTLAYDDEALLSECTCPYFTENLEICKHEDSMAIPFRFECRSTGSRNAR